MVHGFVLLLFGAAIRGEHPAAIAFDDVLDDMGGGYELE